mmetsp:Transcript_38419/g.75096  ORF Transcript_38419/g.75096 Transcript_38419/m.75096 type:complete len:183 (+) Transcript_38419:37-585(+)
MTKISKLSAHAGLQMKKLGSPKRAKAVFKKMRALSAHAELLSQEGLPWGRPGSPSEAWAKPEEDPAISSPNPLMMMKESSVPNPSPNPNPADFWLKLDREIEDRAKGIEKMDGEDRARAVSVIRKMMGSMSASRGHQAPGDEASEVTSGLTEPPFKREASIQLACAPSLESSMTLIFPLPLL